MVFLIQNTQNRDARILHLKLDELIRAMAGARNELINMDTLTDEQLNALEEDLRRTHAHASRHLDRIAALRKSNRVSAER
jgi:low affinity Fe/Cu permease